MKLTDKVEIHFLELPKIEDKLDIGKNKLLDWLIYFKYYNDREAIEKLLEKNKMIKTAVGELELNKILSDPEARRLYEVKRKREVD